MDKRLIDASRPFKVLYSLYECQHLGCLISAHVVPVMQSGQLSLAYQDLFPVNIEQFAHGVDAIDNKLVQLTWEIIPKNVVKKFGGDHKNLPEFFDKKYKGPLKDLVTKYVNRRMAEIMPLLANKRLYLMANDGYPAQRHLELLQDKAGIHFHFIRESDHTRYFPTIRLNGEPVKFINKDAQLAALDPAWLMVDDKVFTFTEHLDGKKLKPFLQKPFIRVPLDKEEEYFKKFVAPLMEKHHVRSNFFEIRTVKAAPRFTLKVEPLSEASLAFRPQVSYDRFTLQLKDDKSVETVMEKNGDGSFIFYRICRDGQREASIRTLFRSISPNSSSLTPFDYLSREEGLAWLAEHSALLEENQVVIQQPRDQQRINLERPVITMETQEEGDWFDIKAMVHIGEFVIPFLKFRKHILTGKHEYQLPDGSICILPEEWFSDYRHLLEVSEKKDEESMRIRKYQAPLLNFPSSSGQRIDLMKVLMGKKEMPKVEPPKGLRAELRGYQQEGLNWLYFLKSHGIGGILADDMGLGKTIQALSLLLKEKEAGVEIPSLIVLPTSLINNWYNEAARFTPDLKVYIHTGVNRSRDLKIFEDYNLILTTYGIVRQDLDVLKEYPFHYAILDESQMIKNPASKISRAVKKLVAQHRLSLTGTPIENTVLDVWSQMTFLNPGLLGNEAFFKRFYVQPIEKDKDIKRTTKLRRVIYPFILRRRKRQVEKELPPKIERLHYCGMDEVQQEVYENTRSQYRNYLMQLVNNGTYRKNKLNLLAGLQKLRQIAIHPKLIEPQNHELSNSGKYQEIKRMLAEVIKKKAKVLIFSQFVKMLHLLRDDLIKEGIPFCYLDGSTRDRQDQVDIFQTDKTIPVFLISLKAGGVGLNLTAAEYVFILDPWWNPAAENQAIDRSHRIGQEKTVIYYKFITEDTIEEKILSLQQRKSRLTEDLIAVEEDIYKSMTESDFEDLLK